MSTIYWTGPARPFYQPQVTEEMMHLSLDEKWDILFRKLSRIEHRLEKIESQQPAGDREAGIDDLKSGDRIETSHSEATVVASTDGTRYFFYDDVHILNPIEELNHFQWWRRIAKG